MKSVLKQLGPVGYEVSAYNFRKGQNVYSVMANIVSRLGLQKIGVEERDLTLEAFRKWEQELGGVGTRVEGVGPVVWDLRGVKDPWEIEQIRRANKASARAFSEVLEKCSRDTLKKSC